MMKVVDGEAIQLTLPWHIADRVTACIEKSKQIFEHGTKRDVLVYWDQPEIEMLARILDEYGTDGTQAISPIFKNYAWGGLYKPFKHQMDTASFLSVRRRAFCFNEAGTGKTSAAIWAADYLMKAGLIKRVLVVCPLSIMQSAWLADIFKTAMHRTAGIAYGDSDRRRKIISGQYEFVIINYDGIPIVHEDIQKADFDLIIIDEANAYKTSSTKRWKLMAKLITASTWLWMMTGTPASQSPVDAFGLARLVSPQRVPKYATAWRDKVMYQATRFKWVPKAQAKQDVYAALQPAIRFEKRSCLDLPSITYQTRYVPLTPQVSRFYKALKSQLLIEAAGEQVSAVNAAAAMSKLLQISGGAVYTDKRDVVEFDVGPRLQAMKEVLDETLNKVIVFVPYLHTIGVVQKFLTEQGYTSEIICGDVSMRQRTEIIARFQSSENLKVLIIQPQSASHGVTLTAADTIIFWSPVMSVETYIQCVGRIDRVGQVNKMTVVNLQGSEAEKKVYDMLQGKIDSHLKLVDLYRTELEEV